MKYRKNRWFKTSFIAFPLLISIAIFVYFSNHNKISQRNISQPDITLLSSSGESFDNFTVEKIFIVKRKDNSLFFSFSADKVIHRKRISKFFTYQNLKEILLSGVQIDFYPYNIESLKDKNILLPLDDIGSSFASLGKPSTPIEEYLEGTADIDLDLLSRVVFENLSLNIFLSPDKQFSISARLACVNVDFENIVLEGPVKIVDSKGKELHAPEAVWSKKFNGIYLPEEYVLNNKHFNGKAFYTINTKGIFTRVLKVPNIERVDFIEEREKILYAYLSKNVPPYLKLMFGILEER